LIFEILRVQAPEGLILPPPPVKGLKDATIKRPGTRFRKNAKS
jgi:hypothetical protein